jgi:hypothetical protein
MANNIKISQLPEITACTLTGVTVFTDNNTSYKASLSTIQDTVRNYKVYSAILNHTDSLDGDNMGNFGEGFIIGEYYTIDTYETGDDFSNVAEVIDGNINEGGCVFRATGTTPTDWSNGSYLYSDGTFIINELENTLGCDIKWSDSLDGGEGYYYAVGYDYDVDDFVRLSSLGTVQTFVSATSPTTCCYSSPSIFSTQYIPDLVLENTDAIKLITAVYDSGIYWTRGLLWNSSFEIRVYPNEGTIKYESLNYALSSSEPKLRTPRVVQELSGSTRTQMMRNSTYQKGDLKKMILKTKPNK